MKDESGNTPLICAVENGHADVLKILLSAGASVEIKDGYGRMALNRAAENGHAEVVKLLVDAGASLNANHGMGRMALVWAIWTEGADAVRMFLDAGVGVDVYGCTHLSRAAAAGKIEVVKILLHAGASVGYGSSARQR